MRPVRSLLFSPGNRPDVVAKGFASEADGVIVDLEDAVPAAEKANARTALLALDLPAKPVFVRVNDASTEWHWPDVVAAARLGAAGVIVPKAESPEDLVRIDGALSAVEAEGGAGSVGTAILPLIESALGVQRAYSLCTASPRVRGLLFGSGEQGDLVADLDCEWTPDGTALLTARAQVLLAARAAGIEHPLDAVFMNIADLDALRVESELARRMGYVGKTAIHPAQLPVIHEVFTPDPELVAEQRSVLAAFDEAIAAGQAAVSVNGRMVDYAVARRARSIIARAEGSA
jgi:citrate lyase subunit beta / citryl-CoA lyase